MNQGKLMWSSQRWQEWTSTSLGISELKCTGMGKFSSDDYYIYYCGQEYLKRNGVALTVNKESPKCSIWVQSQQWQNDLGSFPRQTIQHDSNSSLLPKHWCRRRQSWAVLRKPTTPSKTNTKKRCPFHHRGLECKSRKSRDTQNNRQGWPQRINWSRAKANSFVKRTRRSQQTPYSNNLRDYSTYGHHQIVNIEIQLIMFFAAKNENARRNINNLDTQMIPL